MSRHAEKLRDVIALTISSVFVPARAIRVLFVRDVLRPVFVFCVVVRDTVPLRDSVVRALPVLRVVMRADCVVGTLRD